MEILQAPIKEQNSTKNRIATELTHHGQQPKTYFEIQICCRLASVGGAVIQAIGRPEFEDGLWTGVHLEDSWCPSRVRTNPVVKMAPCLTLGAHPGRC